MGDDENIERIFEQLRNKGHMELSVDPETGEMLGRLTESGIQEAAEVLKAIASMREVSIAASEVDSLLYGANLLRSLAPGRDPAIGEAADALTTVLERWQKADPPEEDRGK